MRSAPFGFCFLAVALTPTAIGRQDVGALIARQPTVAAHWRQHIRASAFGTIHAATFSFSLPIGTAMPKPLSWQLASLDPRAFSFDRWDETFDDAEEPAALQFPTVDRTGKGDRLPVQNPPPTKEAAKPAEPLEATAAAAQAGKAESITPPADTPAIESQPSPAAAPDDKPVVVTGVPEVAPEVADNSAEDTPDPVDKVVAAAPDFGPAPPIEPVVEMAHLYFGEAPLGDAPGALEKWAPGEEPTIVAPAEPNATDIKQSALHPRPAEPEPAQGGETIAPKGEVTGEGKHPLTPAERLKLDGNARTKAEKCLADAVYFEARGEPVRGQIAVAQVVMNRVFSGYYPRSVCGTVYQNKHRRLACQFTFACDGIPDVVTEPNAWVRAMRIARDVLDGKYWVPEVNRATHYHAYWVRPRWVREMKRLYKVGVHTFYRPRNWGDGGDAPSWGSAAATNEAIAKL